jgi:hypothetical protein
MTKSILRALLALGVGAFALLAAEHASAQGLVGSGSVNCGMAKSRTTGCLFQSTTNPGAAISDGARPVKTGRACGFNVLQLVAIGDMRPSTDARSAGITKVAAIESEAFEILPGFGAYKIFGQYCSIVKGE